MHNLWGCRLARPESRKIERAEAFQLEKLENEPNRKKPTRQLEIQKFLPRRWKWMKSLRLSEGILGYRSMDWFYQWTDL